ncbi:MAG: undecaprenyl-phosphate glucose phosphotransferase [Deltaproteobacteria bacterium]|nr:undecaprenyl-phosphate glucose phosphotransferase [Deltaproteobacteria bacterium]
MKRRGILREHANLLDFFLQASDWLVLIASAWLSHGLYLQDWRISPQDGQVIAVVVILSAIIFPKFSLYQSWRGLSFWGESRALAGAFGFSLLGFTALAFVTKVGALYSRGWILTWGGVGFLGLVVTRLAVRLVLRWARKHGYNQRSIVIAGSLPQAQAIANQIQANPWTGFHLEGIYSDDTTPGNSKKQAGKRGTLRQLVQSLQKKPVDQVWIALPLGEEAKLKRILHDLRHFPVDIRYAPDISGLRLLNHALSEVAGISLMDLSVSPMAGRDRLLKALEDRLLAGLILLLISPLMVWIAMGVKLTSKGPVFYRQMRHGWDGKPFAVLKFRSMRHTSRQETRPVQATRHDPRITPLGRWLRRTSLDELPQFINVLKGDMSIVGPRPHALAHNEFYKDQIDGYMKRHKVKPGITGWAQINGWRGETDTLEKMQRRVEYDLYYVENWSLLFDLKIILLTLFHGFHGKNAY